MLWPLGYADASDPNAMNLTIILVWIGILAVVGILAFALILAARARQHRYAETILVLTIFWALIAAGISIYAANAQFNWSKEYTQRLETGYMDPRDTGSAPRLPWGTWTGLAVAYGGMMAWAVLAKREAKYVNGPGQ